MATADRTTKLDDDLTVSAIGFGAGALTSVYGDVDDAAARDSLRDAPPSNRHLLVYDYVEDIAERWLPYREAHAKRILSERAEVHVRYTPGKGSVEKIMQMCTGRGFSIRELAVEQSEGTVENDVRAIHLQLSGRRGVESLVVAIGDIKGVVSASLSASQNAKE